MMFKRWVVGCQLGVALLAMSAGVPAMSGAATAPASKTPTSTTPNVSSVTVTVPGSATVTSPDSLQDTLGSRARRRSRPCGLGDFDRPEHGRRSDACRR